MLRIFLEFLKIAMNRKEAYEVLLLACRSADPFSTIVLDPRTGISCWSYRGTELQGGVSGAVEPIGRNPQYMMVCISDKPVLYAVSLKNKMGSAAIRSILPFTLKHLVSHPSGSFIIGSAENRIYAWMITTGELLCVVEDNFQDITAMKLSNCGSYLVSGTADGTVKVYLTSSIVNQKSHGIERVKAFSSWAAHSLSVQDIYITLGRNPRILTVSLDQTLVFYSVSSRQVLLKVSADCQLTSVCMDAAETKIFLGSSGGSVCVLDICSQLDKKEASINLLSENSLSYTGIRLFQHHSAEVCKLSINFDGTRLASADKTGHYCIWDVSNGQCLNSSTMKGPVTVLKFVEYWPILSEQKTKMLPSISCAVLCKSQVVGEAVIVRKLTQTVMRNCKDDFALRCNLDCLILKSPFEVEKGVERKDTNAQFGKRPRIDSGIVVGDGVNTANVMSLEEKESMAKVRELEKEISRILKINSELYNFCANIVLDEDS